MTTIQPEDLHVTCKAGATACWRCCPWPRLRGPCTCPCHRKVPVRVSFVIPTPATGKNSKRLVRFGNRPALIKSKEALETMADTRRRAITAVAANLLPLFGDDDVGVTVKHHVAANVCEVVIERLGPPPNVPGWRKRDTPNLPDVVLDALQRIVYRNDNQVARLVVERH